MWPLRVGPTNPSNGQMGAGGDSTSGGDDQNRSFDNTLVMSFVEHTIVLTLTGEEVGFVIEKSENIIFQIMLNNWKRKASFMI